MTTAADDTSAPSKYSQRLKDPRWQRKRLEIFNRDNFSCVACGTKEKSLQVHHLVYWKRDPWDYPDYLYQTLCEDCHSVRQEITDKIVTAIRIAIKDIPTQRLSSVAQSICDAATLEINLSQIGNGENRA